MNQRLADMDTVSDTLGASPPRHRRSLAPREHGAYGQLAVPMAAALASARPGPSALLLAASAWAFFLAHEPALVLLGRRGARVRVEEGSRAAVRMLVLGVVAAGLGAAGCLLAPRAVQWAVLPPAALGAAFGLAVALGRERSAWGEVLAAVTLAGVAFPIGIACGLGGASAARAWLVWALGFTALVPPVRAIGARRRGRSSVLIKLWPATAAAALAVALLGTVLAPIDLVALAPLLSAGVWLAVAPPDPRHLRRVGWTIVGATLLTAGALVLTARL